jgi:hypothetical protein
LAIASVIVAVAAAGIATFATVAPAAAASLTQDADTQIAIFVVPLALLLLAVVFEVTRFAVRNPALPDNGPPRRLRGARHWKPGRGEG